MSTVQLEMCYFQLDPKILQVRISGQKTTYVLLGLQQSDLPLIHHRTWDDLTRGAGSKCDAV